MQLQQKSVGVCKKKPDSHLGTDAVESSINYTNEPPAQNMSAKSDPPEASADHIRAKDSPKQMKMLLVEDSKLLRYILFDAINHIENVNVTDTATTQQQAISLLDKTQFDIVLLDIELAQGNGFEVIKHIQQKSYAFRPPVLLMLTNHAHPHYRNLAKTLGVPYFFDKSMDFDLAIDAIELEANRFSNTQH